MKAIINYSTALLHEMLSTHGNSRVEEEGKEFSGLFFRAPQFCGKASALSAILVALSRQILLSPFFSLSTTSSLALAASQSGTKKPLPLFIPLP